jgi:serine/threonine protein kinase
MTYGSEYLEYKKNRWKKFYFRNVESWEAYPGNPPRIVLRSAARNTTEEREFHIPEEFDKWLYCIVCGVMEYSKAKIPKRYLLHISPHRRRKILARRDLRKFDMKHEVFLAVSKGLEDAVNAKERLGPVPEPVGFHPEVVSGPSVAGRTRGGVAYGTVGRSIGSGGSDTMIYRINQLLEPILMRDENGVRIERPAIPMAVKVPKYEEFNEGQAYKDLVKEARILAAIGRHPNIIGLVDAQLASRSRLYLFMEIGDHDLGDHSLTAPQASRNAAFRSPVIRRHSVGILSGIAHMHQRRIYHLDMKPDNVLFCDGVPKIIDFGLSKTKAVTGKNKMFNETWSEVGTTGFQAPECLPPLVPKISNENQLAKLDSYAVGITLFEALLGPNLSWRLPPGRDRLFNDTHAKTVGRIAHWQGLTQNPAERRRLRTKGLLKVSEIASGLIDQDPGNRLFVEDALESLMEYLNQRRERMANRRRTRAART